jgi:hypothetical protein
MGRADRMNAAVLFSVSLMFISLELYFTRILNLKTWNHVVYIIIPFAILGYGVGANLCLIARPFLKTLEEQKVLYWSLLTAALSSIASTLLLIHIPVQLSYLDTILMRFDSVLMLVVAYSILMIPFVVIGFMVVYLFQAYPSQSPRLYFFDLLGAGIGALTFFVLIERLQVLHSIVLLSLILLLLAFVLSPRRRAVSLLSVAFVASIFVFLPEPVDYVIDSAKGWEWVPGYFEKHQYEHSFSRWHPMGRTDVFRILDHDLTEEFLSGSGRVQSTSNPADVSYVTAGTFEINLIPPPEFSYVSTNFLAGTPIYNLSSAGLRERGSRLTLFSQPMEAPYVLLRDPSVVIIGTGGGRDIFLARSHGAKTVVGAEINPAIYAMMSPGGKFYGYSGGVYGGDGVQVFNMDGRHLVKNLARDSFDLVVLNGVDTYSGLSNGAYAYAESYLYTKNAIKDYLAVMNDRGIINFNRWFDPEMPRENLRLFVIVMEALRDLGVENPWDHVMIGDDREWAMTLIKKSSFTDPERERIGAYFLEHDTQLIYPVGGNPRTREGATKVFASFVESLKAGHEKEFIDQYPFDISVVTDDKPFFYKHYKFRNFHPFQPTEDHDVGPVMFMTQLLILAQASFFILLFILLPLVVFRRQGIQQLPPAFQRRFILYFSCLGLGFMFIEIPMMQRFTLLLGSPIHSISVTLVALLIATGTGSLLLPSLRKRFGSHRRFVLAATAGLVLYTVWLILGAGLFDLFMSHGFLVRSLVVMASVFPLGILLGIYFPFGLELVGRRYEQTIPWAWGINSGFSVLGGISSIILAQLIGFNMILMLACLVYLVAGHSLTKMLEWSPLGADG